MSPHEDEHSIHFFLDAVRYESEHATLTGAQIKAKGNVTPSYQLYLEEQGDTPDRAISDGEGINLQGEVKHFYAVPPATFGAQ